MRLIKDLGILYTSETKKYKKRYGIYECPYCLNHVKVLSTHVVQGNIKSCGCLKKITMLSELMDFLILAIDFIQLGKYEPKMYK